jgi:hypothetical protein
MIFSGIVLTRPLKSRNSTVKLFLQFGMLLKHKTVRWIYNQLKEIRKFKRILIDLKICSVSSWTKQERSLTCRSTQKLSLLSNIFLKRLWKMKSFYPNMPRILTVITKILLWSFRRAQSSIRQRTSLSYPMLKLKLKSKNPVSTLMN